MTILGIDIGLGGAIAALSGDTARVWDLPTRLEGKGRRRKTRINEQALAVVIKEAISGEATAGDVLVFVEQAQATPQMGVGSAFGYGMTFGVIRGALALLGASVRFVQPVVWKRHMGLVKTGSREIGRDAMREKDSSLDLARRLYPQLADDLRLKKHEGRADALLIAHYGAEEMGL